MLEISIFCPLNLEILVQTFCYYMKGASSLHFLRFFLYKYCNWDVVTPKKFISIFFQKRINDYSLSNILSMHSEMKLFFDFSIYPILTFTINIFWSPFWMNIFFYRNLEPRISSKSFYFFKGFLRHLMAFQMPFSALGWTSRKINSSLEDISSHA